MRQSPAGCPRQIHITSLCANLTDDYDSTHFSAYEFPLVREAAAHFARSRKHYLITSGTTGYLPNPSEAAVADTWHSPYRVLGNPHLADESQTSFHSPIFCIFKVPEEKDLYIACADRWVPDKMYLNPSYACTFDLMLNDRGNEIPALAEAMGISQEKMEESIADAQQNTSMAGFVRLSLRFEGDMAYIDWKDQWKLSSYKSAKQRTHTSAQTAGVLAVTVWDFITCFSSASTV